MKIRFQNHLLLSVFLFSNLVLAQSESGNLDAIINKVQEHKFYDREEFPLGLYTEKNYKNQAEFAEERIAELQKINADSLSETEKISLELLKFKLQEDIDEYKYEAYLNPLLSDAGFHLSLAYQVRDLNNYSQVKAYLNKLNAIPTYVDQHLVLLRKGLEKGITQPRVIFEGYESTYNDQLVDSPRKSYFFEPFENLPRGLSDAQKDSVLQAAEEAISKNVVPQFYRIKDFFENEYLPNTRTELGVSEIPNGREYYQNRLDYYTTLDLSAEEVHQIGLDEVARINAEMKEIIKEVEFDGSFEDFIHFLRTDEQFYAKTAEELLK
ncbi:MAG TPA: DUF885 domain-containing protein, partial [Salegentibacter sp.]|nr:DUF885 domain-containing protein [Salegentibacter sp.]